MNADLETYLEKTLLEYGAIERHLTEKIQTLSVHMREAFQDGREHDGLKMEQSIALMKDQLKAIEPVITKIENKLYGIRSRKKS